MSLSIVGQGGHDRHDTLGNQIGQHIAIDQLHVAHKAVIHLLDGPLLRADSIHICPGQTKGIHAAGLKSGHNLLVDQSSIDHRHHAEHFGVGNASALHHAALYAQSCSQPRGRTSSSVHQYFMSGQQGKTVKQVAQALFLLHNLASNLYNSQFIHVLLYQ